MIKTGDRVSFIDKEKDKTYSVELYAGHFYFRMERH